MIISKIDKGLGISYRKNGKLERKYISFNEFQPYFYIGMTITKPNSWAKSETTSNDWESVDFERYSKMYIKDNFGSVNVKIQFEKTDAVSLHGDNLMKVTWKPSRPEYTRRIAERMTSYGFNTYEGDVPFHYRYAVDEIQDMPEYEMRKMYWDMEWMQGGEYDDAITCIVAYDSFDKQYTTFGWFPDEAEFIPTDGLDEANNDHRFFEDEQGMLEEFLKYVMDKDPDMLLSWFGWKFDMPKLLQRLVHHKIDPRFLSPFQEIDGIGWKEKVPTYSKRIENWSPIYQPVKGRICFPLDLAFERQWNDAQKGTLPSMALDYVAETVLGEKKLVSEKFPDKNEFFKRGWLEDTETYLEYARVDVELLVRIDNSNHTSESVLALQRLLKAPFDACFYASNMGSIYFMRHAHWKAPTGKKGERADYDGAMVYDPLSEGTNGLHHNVAAFDFAGLYPSMIISRNISWETISKEPTELAVNIKTPKDFSPVVEKYMRYFKTDKLGLLPRSVLELKTLRQKYKENMKKYPDEYAKWNNNQLAVKRLMASFYGIIAYQGFGWADVRLAESITASAREAIREAARLAKEMD
tara:strand:+ start:3173 stop:4915 length:1743 start_codon:yes stop_codon:yes gene_type:complete